MQRGFGFTRQGIRPMLSNTRRGERIATMQRRIPDSHGLSNGQSLHSLPKAPAQLELFTDRFQQGIPTSRMSGPVVNKSKNLGLGSHTSELAFPTTGKLLPKLRGKTVVLDVETTGLDPYHGARIFCFSYMSNKGEFGFVWKTPEAIAWVQSLFDDPEMQIVFHNAKFDLKMFSFEGIDVFNIKATIHCTLICTKLYNGMWNSYELVDLGLRLLNRNTADKTAITDWLKKNGRRFVKEYGRKPNFSDAPVELLKRRALWDAETTLKLFYFVHSRVMKICPDLYETERDLMFVVVDMENTGVQVDITRARKLKAEASENILKLKDLLNKLIGPFTIRKSICSLCRKVVTNPILKQHGHKPLPSCARCGGAPEVIEEQITEFNPNSPVHMPVVFEKLGFELKYLTKPKKGKKGGKPTGGGNWSFDEYAMIRYVSPLLGPIIRDSGDEGWAFQKFLDAIISAVRQHRLPRSHLVPPLAMKMKEMSKMISTYYDHIIEDSVDVHFEPSGREVGTFHCQFNQSEALTGRFSANGGLQTMPRILGPRECFIPRKGRRNWHKDYTQVEMRFFAIFSGDPKLKHAFENGIDVHKMVASELYNKPMESISSEQKKKGKGVNFGIVYGSGAEKQSETLTSKGIHTTVAEATTLVRMYHRKFPTVRRTTARFKVDLARNGYVETPYHRRYHVPSKYSYRVLNYMCQGSSADCIKRAMVAIWKYLRSIGSKAKILMQIHDELCIETPPSEEVTLVPKIIELMEDRTSFPIPILVDAKVVVKRWSEKLNPKEVMPM